MMPEACRLGNSQSTLQLAKKSNEKFCLVNTFCVFISLVTILADLTTETLVFAEYCKNGFISWAVLTIIFILMPNIIINIFSLRWIITDEKRSLRKWITHVTLCGFFERFMIFLCTALSCKNIDGNQIKQFVSQRNDLSLLHFLYTLTGTAPQIILQSYAMIILKENHDTKAISLTASIASIVWASCSYVYIVVAYDYDKTQWLTILLKLVWHLCLLTARLSAIIICTLVFGIWTVIFLGLHWAAMAFWIVLQKTTFCLNKFEEIFYNIVMGFVYCFCYVNLREGHTRYRLLIYYSLTLAQNFGSLLIFTLVSDITRQRKLWFIFASILIVAGTLVGMFAMTLYYRWFHAKGPIIWKNKDPEAELNNKIKLQDTGERKNNLKHVRSFKTLEDTQKLTEKYKTTSNENIVKNNLENADKKLLLDQWIARSGTPLFTSAPVDSSLTVSSIDIHTISNSPQINNDAEVINKLPLKPKKKFMRNTNKLSKSLSIEHIEKSIDELTASNMNLNKRRGIVCPSDLIITNIDVNMGKSDTRYGTSKTDQLSEISHDTEDTNKKSSSDSIDLDLELSFSDINSSDINTFNENIVQKLCLSALKNIKDGNQDADIDNIQRIAVDILKEMYGKKGKGKKDDRNDTSRNVDTPTEILSVHDYENICAVNIAREAWGLRSWNGYFDIENWLHDGSVVRDRRRDTITSASSDISSCISQDIKNSIVSAVSAAGFPKKTHTYSNIFMRFDKNPLADYVNADSYTLNSDETFLAKPCFIDSKDPNYLEPIIEELDDVSDFESTKLKKIHCERSLVATIDEIRKATATNSPRNLYHRREHIWDSPHSDSSTKIEYNLKRALWKEPSKINSHNILKSISEKAFTVSSPTSVKCNLRNIEFKTICHSSNNEIGSTNTEVAETNINKINNWPTVTGKNSNNGDISNNMDILWKETDNNKRDNLSFNLSASSKISSTKSFINNYKLEPTNITDKNINVKKSLKSKPRRKFSILRERFEPRPSRNSDENEFYHQTFSSDLTFMDDNEKNCELSNFSNSNDS